MKITNTLSNTSIAEVGDGLYRISTPVPPNPALPGGFTFNQYLIADEKPLLFHTGPRMMFDWVREAVEAVMPVSKLSYVGLSHFESDECGSLNQFLKVAPNAAPLCGQVAKMVSVDDAADRPATGLADGESLSLGRHSVRWLDTPHLPHGWECGYLFEESTKTLLCGDLFTQPGADHPPMTEGDILGSSEGMRSHMEYYSHTPNTTVLLNKLAALSPKALACMHGSAWHGNGADLLLRLGKALATRN